MRFHIILTLAIVFSFFALTLQAQQKKRVDIGVLADKSNAETDRLISLLIEEIQSVIGEDAILSFPKELRLLSQSNADKSLANYNTLVDKGSEIILIFGVVDYVVLSQLSEFPVPTIIFGAAPIDFSDEQPTKKVNLTMLSDAHSIIEDLNALGLLFDYESIAIAHEADFVANFDVEDVLSSNLDSDINYRIIPFDNADDIIADLGDEEAFYLGGGFLLDDQEIKKLADELIRRNIPSFTATSVKDVELGLMGTNQPATNFDQMFRRIALTVESIVNDADPSDLSSSFNSEKRLSLNVETSARIGLSLRYSMLADINIIGNKSNIAIDKTYNLKEVMLESINKNLGLQSSLKNVELAEQEVKTAKSNYFPQLNATVTGSYVDPALAEVSNGQNPEMSTAGNLSLNQTVYSPSVTANLKIQKQLKEAESENYNTDKLDAIFNAANAYFNILLAKSNLQINVRNLDVTKRNLELAQQRFDAGEAGKSDILRFTSERAQNTQALIETSNFVDQSTIALNQILNYPLDRKVDVEDPELGVGLFKDYKYDQIMNLIDNPITSRPFIGYLVKEAKANAPELKALNYNINATNLSYNLAKGGRFVPSVALQGQYVRTLSRSGVGTEFPMGFPVIPDGYYTTGVSLTLPIFQQNQQNINQQTAQIQLEQLGVNLQNINLSIDQGVNNAVLQLINQITNIELSQVSVEAARESLELTQESYAQGAVNRVQLIDEQDNYFRSQLANANAIYNYLLSVLQLERTLGMYFLLNTQEQNDDFNQRFSDYLQTR
ncbi:MAG: TolC family protein [Cyclobacteriaceae bacterium]